MVGCFLYFVKNIKFRSFGKNVEVIVKVVLGAWCLKFESKTVNHIILTILCA